MSYQTMKRHVETLNAYYQLKKANLKGYTLYDSNYKTFWKKQNSEGSEQISGCQAWLGEV